MCRFGFKLVVDLAAFLGIEVIIHFMRVFYAHINRIALCLFEAQNNALCIYYAFNIAFSKIPSVRKTSRYKMAFHEWH